METALAFLIPEAEPIVAPYRGLHDPSAAEGMPAHVTVLVPFMDLDAIDRTALADVIAETPGFALSFPRLERFPGTLWLSPEPAGPIAALTERLARRYPDFPPYGGQFAEIIPHLTVAQGPEDLLDAIAAQLVHAPPIQARVSHCRLFAHGPGRWQERASFPLGR